jgi:predicted MFS family arabinose efflux permease
VSAGRLVRRLLTLATIVLLLATLAQGLGALRLFERDIGPQLHAKGDTVARALAGRFGRVAGYGLELEELRGVEELLAEAMRERPELPVVAVVDADGRTLYAHGPGAAGLLDGVTTTQRLRLASGRAENPPTLVGGHYLAAAPILAGGTVIGAIVVGSDAGFVQRQMAEIGYDLLAVLIVALLVAGELLRRVRLGGGGPAGGPEGAARVRLPLFLFFFAEELSRPFFPVFAGRLLDPGSALSPELAVSLPMTLFMLVVALAQPVAGRLVGGIGHRRMLAAGALLGSCGLALTAFAPGLASLIAFRLLTALGYGLVFAAGQAWVVASSGRDQRSAGLAQLVGTVLTASIAGNAIGGILGDRIGFESTFLVGALLALLALVVSWRSLPARGGAAAERQRARGSAALRPRFLALALLAGVPAKVLLTGFLYYLVPLHLAALEASPAATGRTLMAYGLLMVMLAPRAAALADRTARPLPFVIAGGLAAGAGLLLPSAAGGIAAVVAAVIVLGIAQAASITAQLSLVQATARDEAGQAAALGDFRLIERLGSALGPVLAAILLAELGHEGAALALGAGSVAAALLLALLWWPLARAQESATLSPRHAAWTRESA